MTTDPWSLWQWLPLGYLLTVAVEAPVLMAGLRWPRDAVAPQGRVVTPALPAVLAWRLMLAAWLTAVIVNLLLARGFYDLAQQTATRACSAAAVFRCWDALTAELSAR